MPAVYHPNRPLLLMTVALFASLLLASCNASALPVDSSPAPLVSPSTHGATAERTTAPESYVTPLPTAEPYPYVWVTNTHDHAVLAVDPATNAAGITLKLEGKPGSLAAGMGALWVVEQRSGQPDQVLRVEPTSGRLLSSITLEPGRVSSLFAGAGAIWAGFNPSAPSSDPSRPPQGLILRIDPTTGEVDRSLPLDGSILQVCGSPEAVWALYRYGAFTRLAHIDPVNLQATYLPAAVPSLDFVHQFARIVVAPGGLWAASRNASARFIYQIDPADGRITAAIASGAGPQDTPLDLAVDSRGIWAALRSGKVILVDPQKSQVIASVDTHTHLDELIQSAGAAWALDRSQAMLYRLDPTGQVSALVSTGRKMPPTPVPMPTLLPGEQVCQGNYPSNLKTGIRAMVKPVPPLPNRVRSEPNRTSRILGEIDPGEEGEIIDGPVCTEGWVWWKINARDGDLIGWTAEGDGSDYWLIPAP